MNASIRSCPICSGRPSGRAFPYQTQFNERHFAYVSCGKCHCVYVDPIPDDRTFELMYAKEAYHDRHYAASESPHYSISAQLLSCFAPNAAQVLDYGCGFGAFLRHLRSVGMVPTGVEFDSGAAANAEAQSREKVYSLEQFEALQVKPSFDVIHFGDVLEHVPDPVKVLRNMLQSLRPGGLLFAEGPLEINASPVYWAASAFGFLKNAWGKKPYGSNPPTHLMRVNARQQKQMFDLVGADLELIYWEIEETGWPYASGSFIKRRIADVSRALGGVSVMGITFGNRFRAIYRYKGVGSSLPAHSLGTPA